MLDISTPSTSSSASSARSGSSWGGVGGRHSVEYCPVAQFLKGEDHLHLYRQYVGIYCLCKCCVIVLNCMVVTLNSFSFRCIRCVMLVLMSVTLIFFYPSFVKLNKNSKVWILLLLLRQIITLVWFISGVIPLFVTVSFSKRVHPPALLWRVW